MRSPDLDFSVKPGSRRGKPDGKTHRAFEHDYTSLRNTDVIISRYDVNSLASLWTNRNVPQLALKKQKRHQLISDPATFLEAHATAAPAPAIFGFLESRRIHCLMSLLERRPDGFHKVTMHSEMGTTFKSLLKSLGPSDLPRIYFHLNRPHPSPSIVGKDYFKFVEIQARIPKDFKQDHVRAFRTEADFDTDNSDPEIGCSNAKDNHPPFTLAEFVRERPNRSRKRSHSFELISSSDCQ